MFQIAIWAVYLWMLFPEKPYRSEQWTNPLCWVCFSVTGIVVAELLLISQKEKGNKKALYKTLLVERTFCLTADVASILIASSRVYDFYSASCQSVTYVPHILYTLKELVGATITSYFLLYVLLDSHKKSLAYAVPLLISYLLWFNLRPSLQEAQIFSASFSAAFLRFRILILLLIAYSVIVKKKPMERTLQWVLCGFFLTFMLSYLRTTKFPAFAFEQVIAYVPFRILVYAFWAVVLFKKFQELNRDADKSVV